LPVQRRSVHYAQVVSKNALLAFITFISDHKFPSGSIELYRSPLAQKYFLVTIEDDADKYTLALRVLTEVVGVVIDEQMKVNTSLLGVNKVSQGNGSASSFVKV
jgi:hypothetical protein